MANGGIIGTVNIPTSTTATGVWQQEEQYEAKVTDTWPQRALFTTKSARFNDGSSDYLNRTSSSTGNKKTFTISYWCKRGNLTLGNTSTALSSGNFSNGDNHTYVGFQLNTDTARIQNTVSGSTVMSLISTALYRDVSAWYNFVWKVDTTQSTESDRVKLYVNGIEQTISGTYPTQNQDTFFGSDDTYRVGVRFLASATYWDGYLAEVCYVDGSALAPTSFGEFNSQTGIWVPKVVTGLTFGTNGFYLPFTNSGALGEDFSGNNNDFTVNNLTSLDQSTDTCSTNFATINPLYVGLNANFGISEGNLKGLNSGAGDNNYVNNFGVSSGKWYVEAKATMSGNAYGTIGIVATDSVLQTNGSWLGSTNDSWYYSQNGHIGTSGGSTSTGHATYTTGDIISVALNLDDNELLWYKNGAVQNSGTATSITANKTYFIGGRVYDTSTGWEFNFGSPMYAISSGNTDGNGFGNFEYAVPTGFLSLNTKNLAAVLA